MTEKMIDRSKAFWAWVWNSQKSEGTKRLVIDINNYGSCLAVLNYDETSFLDGGPYDTQMYFSYERIPEPKKRLMTREELLGFIAWNPHIVVRIQDEPPQVSNKFNFIRDMQMYSWAPITEAGEIGEWNKFEVSDGLH